LDNASDIRKVAESEQLGGTVELKYVARAGLLPELSRQTYDRFYKAIRESVLNAMDAGATQIDLDFSRLAEDGAFVVSDDGSGMSMHEFCDQFMSLGGSTKFGDDHRFGRIGIGSLALLHYGSAAIVETKQAGSASVVRAHIEHPWNLDRPGRRTYLQDLEAGTAAETAYEGAPGDHFTKVRIIGAQPELANTVEDPSAFYLLIDKLRRILPLPWAESRLTDALERISPTLTNALRTHVLEWSVPVVVHSEWERAIPLSRRLYGDDAAGVEAWVGPPMPIEKTLRVSDDEGSRRITVLGFLLNQRQPLAAWSGVTARLQNVAIEEQTFFDITADPGFRKYITGDVWFLGEIDRNRLINIDRSTFNRESPDYKVLQRHLARTIIDFKAGNVQRPQRQKVEIRKALEHRRATLQAVQTVVDLAATLRDVKRLPSSETTRRIRGERVDLKQALAELGVAKLLSTEGLRSTPYRLTIGERGDVLVEVDPRLGIGVVHIGKKAYHVVFVRGASSEPPVVIRNRPAEIVFNIPPAGESARDHRHLQAQFALELAYLLTQRDGAPELYELMSSFIEAT
jgi:hypothetical protein